ncbi:hypothetical protein BSG1_12446 [Bacillus sp. SG-1]|nr:hypothetical protein BSG1_12446 [Bacillus sp. SG-1]
MGSWFIGDGAIDECCGSIDEFGASINDFYASIDEFAASINDFHQSINNFNFQQEHSKEVTLVCPPAGLGFWLIPCGKLVFLRLSYISDEPN